MRVRYVREGTGPAIVLLHGSGSSLDAFDAVARRLQDRATSCGWICPASA
jgi:pimeloyl-ACP methyl ester carboxylesterase